MEKIRTKVDLKKIKPQENVLDEEAKIEELLKIQPNKNILTD
jgi:hypothetical protein